MVVTTLIDETGIHVLDKYDEFVDWAGGIVKYFETVKDYSGYPVLPDTWLGGIEIYRAASDREKEMIANRLIGLFLSCLRHWRVDQDDLYGPGRREKQAWIDEAEKLLTKPHEPHFPVG